MKRETKLKHADQTLKRMVLENKLALATPVLNRSAGGIWTLTYAGPPIDNWQIWARSGSYDPAWSVYGEVDSSQFPVTDAVMTPGGTWWQVKACGEDADGNIITAFSNTISFGPVPA